MLKYRHCAGSDSGREPEEVIGNDGGKLCGEIMVWLSEPVPLDTSQKERASEVLTHAFHNDPMWTYIFPDADERARSLYNLWQALIGYCLVYGEVYTTPQLKGVACWLAPGNTEQTLWRLLRTGLGFVRAVMKYEGEARSRFMGVLSYTDSEHKRIMKTPHWYLWALGVEPDSQRQGVGCRMIQPVLAHAAAEDLPCYLETQTEGNVVFYRKRGFQVLSEAEVPGTGMKVWAMVKKP